MTPGDTERLRFREMHDDDLENMHSLLGDPEVMKFYPHPFTRAETQHWIDKNRRRYADDGVGLWIIETKDGDFVGDCGLTWQVVDGQSQLEVGYHVLHAKQGLGYATEAAAACRDYAAKAGNRSLIAIIYPGNRSSARVAEKIGLLSVAESTDSKGNPFNVHRGDLPGDPARIARAESCCDSRR